MEASPRPFTNRSRSDVEVIRMAETETGKVSLTPQRFPRISSNLSDRGIRYS